MLQNRSGALVQLAGYGAEFGCLAGVDRFRRADTAPQTIGVVVSVQCHELGAG